MTDGDLRSIFRKHLPRADWLSVETGLTEQGVPDMNGCLGGVEFWLENKTTHGWTVPLRPAQVGWIQRRCRSGGRVFIAVRRTVPPGKRTLAADELWLIHGAYATIAKADGLRGLPEGSVAGVWKNGPERWCWAEIEAALTK
jgi:hypothetical protein